MVLAALALLVVGAASPVSADGFEVVTVEDIGENTATCDFDGSGFKDYWVVPEQTVLLKIIESDVTEDYIHVTALVKFDEVEYVFPKPPDDPPPGWEPDERIFLTSDGRGESTVEFFPDLGFDIVTLKSRGHSTWTDGAGTVLFSGGGGFDVQFKSFYEDIPEEVISERYVGKPGNPCKVGVGE